MQPSQDTAADGLVSVILPTYNRARTLRRAIDSILNQSYRNLEVLVVDDGSKDDTAAVMAEISDPRVRYLPLEQNRGASRARNAGLRAAKGAYIAFQDSDDEWLAGKLERQVAAARAAGGGAVTVFHTKILYGRGENGVYGLHRVCCLPDIPPSEHYDFRRLVQELNIMSPQAVLITREALDKVGPFDELLVNNNDWAFAIDLVYNTDVVFIDEPLVMTYLQNDSISILKRSGVRSQLRIMQKFGRYPGVSQPIMAAHVGRIAWGLTKLGNPRQARRLLIRALKMRPTGWKNWARLIVTQGRIWLGMNQRKTAVSAA